MKHVITDQLLANYSMFGMPYCQIHHYCRPGEAMQTGHPEDISLCGNDPQATALLQ